MKLKRPKTYLILNEIETANNELIGVPYC